MAITDLIANPQMADPVQRYQQGYKFGVGVADIPMQRAEREQAMRINETKMDMLAREEQAKQLKEAMDRMNKYGSDIAPVIKEIMDMPESERSVAYQSKISSLKEIAAANGLVPEKSVSPAWNEDKAAALVQKYYQSPEAPKTREVKVGDEILTQEWKGGAWHDVATGTRTAKSEVRTGEIGKKTQGDVESGIISTSEMLDNLYTLKQRANESPDQFTFWGGAGSSILKIGERLGVPLPEGGQAYIETRQGIQNYSEKVYNTYRRMITGSQASKFELQSLRGQAPTTDDSVTTVNKKINDWIDDAERLRVRYTKIINDGFEPSGSDEEGNAYFTKNGKKYEISKIYDLGKIPSASERVSQIESDVIKGNPDIEDKDLINETLLRLREEGYDTRRWQK